MFLVKQLKDLGADYVITEEFFKDSANVKNLLKDVTKSKLALNCVGGSATGDLMSFMSENGCLVTYGGMSKRPVMIPTSRLIFQDITAKGFWLSRWLTQHSKEEREKMLNQIADFIRRGALNQPVEEFPLEKFPDALDRALEGYRHGKVLLRLS